MITVEKGLIQSCLMEYKINYKRTHVLALPGTKICRLKSRTKSSSEVLAVKNNRGIVIVICNMNATVEFVKMAGRELYDTEREYFHSSRADDQSQRTDEFRLKYITNDGSFVSITNNSSESPQNIEDRLTADSLHGSSITHNRYSQAQISPIEDQPKITEDFQPLDFTEDGAVSATNNSSESPQNTMGKQATDSGYGSTTTYDRYGRAQMFPTKDQPKITTDLLSLNFTDNGFISAMNDLSKSPQNTTDLESDDTKTQMTEYSYASNIPTRKFGRYISELADDLFSKCPSEQAGVVDMKRIFVILLGLLKAFALKVGHNAPTQVHRDIMFFVHKHRK
jgi:hypothetical protein